ncbi:MazG nucleotide pyrophosphohydrolase domain-containing protein [Clostridium sp. DJ247]|uniref:MazG nucleotide pyrophosphohydrolase domain-containing protein n=1 Tax=Clostridium sp. DJ247 TaxID=2726188 RepID=UPI001625042B|nr:MazG nucleotide pyrophosphohydrolase domain-containing protein [Clostridium sp. DJ247]MBC2581649.1 hypothetical protein [Clostridium sp. DJ247]
MELMVLDKDESWNLHKARVYEESLQLVKAIKEDDKAHIAEEVLDNIQVAIGIIEKLYQDGIDIQQIVHRHNKKLVNKGGKAKATIKFQINKK